MAYAWFRKTIETWVSHRTTSDADGLTEYHRVTSAHKQLAQRRGRLENESTHLKNILLMKRSLLMGFLFLPLGTSVHICSASAASAHHLSCGRDCWPLLRSQGPGRHLVIARYAKHTVATNAPCCCVYRTLLREQVTFCYFVERSEPAYGF